MKLERMEIIYWADLVKGRTLFPQGTAVSIGGFDGPHRGHQRIFSAVLEASEACGIPSGLITFFRSPRFVKAGAAYSGDVSTLDMRLQKFTEQGFTFTVLIDFSADFARMKGAVIFDILIKTIRIKYLAVGDDFTCGYRHDTRVEDLRRLAQKKSFCFDSIEQLHSAQHERISSSAIRQAVEQADFALAKDLLGYPFFLDVAKIAQRIENTECFIEKSSIGQILPMNGVYSVCVYLHTGQVFPARVTITDFLLEISWEDSDPIPFTAGVLIYKLEFIRKE